MKKLVIGVFALIVLINLPLNAQFKMGLQPAFGLNYNLHSGSDLPESGSGIGIVFGGYANMDFSKSIGMITGIVFYDNRSGSYSATNSSQGVNYTTDISASLAYFQLESLFKYSLPASDFYFVAGPVLGFNVESEGESTTKITTPGYTFQGGSTSSTNKATIKDTQVRFELKFGAGFEMPITKKLSIVPQLTFGYGLTNVAKDVKWKILTFQALCGVKFEII